MFGGGWGDGALLTELNDAPLFPHAIMWVDGGKTTNRDYWSYAAAPQLSSDNICISECWEGIVAAALGRQR